MSWKVMIEVDGPVSISDNAEWGPVDRCCPEPGLQGTEGALRAGQTNSSVDQ